LLIGDQLRAATLQANLGAIAVTVAAMIVSRALFIYGFGWLSNRLAKSQLTIPEQTILWWGGLRGSVSIALSLSVPVLLSGREQVIAIVFGAVMFTLLVQGLTIKPMLQRLNLLPDEPAREAYIEAIARQAALKRVLHHLEQGEKSPSIEPEFYAYQSSLIRGELASITDKISKLDNQYPNVRDFAKTQLRNELLAIEASTYADFLRAGRLNRQLSPLLEDIAEA
jgi:CPA1 family monovalent cation:H+ antiporter